MTDVRCSRCGLLMVGLRDIIQAGHGDRYQVFMLSRDTQIYPWINTICENWSKKEREVCVYSSLTHIMDPNITFWFCFASSWSVLTVAIPGTPQGMRYQL